MSDYVGHRTLTVADALAWGRNYNPTDEGTLLGLYGLSWLMVEWMVNTHLPEWVRFQKLLVTGMDPEQAWKVVFPTVRSADLDKELNLYAQYGSMGLSTFPIPEVEVVVLHQAPMSAADVHVTRADAARAAGFDKEALEELAAALAVDPANVRALQQQLPRVSPSERLALARRATVAHPDDGLVCAEGKRRARGGVHASLPEGHPAFASPSRGVLGAGLPGGPARTAARGGATGPECGANGAVGRPLSRHPGGRLRRRWTVRRSRVHRSARVGPVARKERPAGRVRRAPGQISENLHRNPACPSASVAPTPSDDAKARVGSGAPSGVK